MLQHRWSIVVVGVGAFAGALACGSGTDSPVPVSPEPAVIAERSTTAAPPDRETTPPPSTVAPPPNLDPVPPITTDIDPSVFHWSHDSDEHAFIEVMVQLGDGPEAETWRSIARAHEGQTKPARDIGMPERFARGDSWIVFGADGSVFGGKAKGFWPAMYGEDMVLLRVVLGVGPEGVAVRARDWTGRPRNPARWGRGLEADDPKLGEVIEVLGRSIAMVAGPQVVALLERRPLTAKDVYVTPGRFCGGSYLVRLDARVDPNGRDSVAGIVILGLDGRLTPVIPVERTTTNRHYVWGTLDLDDDGYDEAVVERGEESGSFANLLYWREGQPQLEPLVLEPA